MFNIIKKKYYNLTNIGKPKFTCSICGYNGPFLDINPRTGYRKYCRCPICNSYERHRLQKLVLDKFFKNIDTSSMKTLHFAPEKFFRNYFKEISSQYITVDLLMDNIDINCDMRNLPFKDNEFDFVYASHVLEHIDDDIKALTEVKRILKSNGIAILPIPVVNDFTVKYEKPNPHESGHVRAPGKDYFERYKKIFSCVNLYRSSDFPEIYQTYLYEDRSQYPNEISPYRKPYYEQRYDDIVPVCIS